MRRGGLVVSTLCSQPIHDGFESSSCTSLYHHVISLGQDSNPSCIGCEQSVLTTRPPRPTKMSHALAVWCTHTFYTCSLRSSSVFTTLMNCNSVCRTFGFATNLNRPNNVNVQVSQG